MVARVGSISAAAPVVHLSQPAITQAMAKLETKLSAKLLLRDRSGVVIPVHGLAGGTGATTLAVNLAWELAHADKDEPPRVVLLDFDLQNGSVATYLDLPRREAVLEMLTDTEAMDSESFMQALLSYNDKVQVLTSPTPASRRPSARMVFW